MTQRTESIEIQNSTKVPEPEHSPNLVQGIWFDPSQRSPDLTVGGPPKAPDNVLETLDRQARKGEGYAAGFTLNALQEALASNPKEFESRLRELRDEATAKNAVDKSLPQISINFGHVHANDGAEDPNLLQVQIQYQQDSKHPFQQILVNETLDERSLQPINEPEYQNAKRFN